MSRHIVPHTYHVSRKARCKANGHNSFLVFFTGLSGSGKSTICNALEQKLFDLGVKTYVLDGDNIRKGISKNLGFSPEDRTENIRRIGEVANLLLDAGIVTLAAFVAPYERDRESIRELVGNDNYVEIYVSTPLEVCEERDVKGLYAKARKGEIPNMTGISAPYEIPGKPDLEISYGMSVPESVEMIYNTIHNKLKLKP